MEDGLVYFGDAVKALDDSGRVGGYLVRFADAKHKDLDGEYFTADTYYGPSDGDGSEALFDHGFPVPAELFRKDISPAMKAALAELADRTFQPIKTKRDAIGIFAETVLNLEDEYEKFIFSRVKKNKIGWSSGAPGHRVKKAEDGQILRWPIAEGSLTPRPAEPLNRAMPIKSLGSVKFVDLEADDLPVKKIDETENEFRYRLRDPKDFEEDSFRTIAIKKDKPRVNGIVGKLKGESSTTLQAYRFPKGDGWTAEDAEDWAVEHKPTKKSFDEQDGMPARLADVFRGLSLSHNLTRLIDDLTDDGTDRIGIIKSLAREAVIEIEEVEQIISGGILRPSDARLKAFARVLKVDFDQLRSFADQDAQKTIKGVYKEALANHTPSLCEATSVYRSLASKFASIASNARLTGVQFDLEVKLRESTDELSNYLYDISLNQIRDHIESGSDEPFYLKAILDLTTDLPVSGNLNLTDHSQLAVSALAEVIKRFRVNHENRVKAGRVLSQRNRERLGAMLQQLQTVIGDCQKLLEESQPMATDEEKHTAESQFLRLQHRDLSQRINQPTGV